MRWTWRKKCAEHEWVDVVRHERESGVGRWYRSGVYTVALCPCCGENKRTAKTEWGPWVKWSPLKK